MRTLPLIPLLIACTKAQAALLDSWREQTDEQGVEWFAGYSAEVWTGLSGDAQGRTVYTGLLEAGVELDLETLLGWEGAVLHNSWLWLSGDDPSDALGNESSFAISNIAGRPGVRMFQLWLEQAFAEDAFSVRMGLLAADDEFAFADSASTLINGSFGWPVFLSENLPNAGPAYPLAAPGVRLQVETSGRSTLRIAALAGDPGSEDSNRNGFEWNISSPEGALLMAEWELHWSEALPGMLKAGGWAHTDNNYRHGFYAVIDQTLVDPGVAVWSRAAYRPDGDAAVRWSVDGGVTLPGLLPGRSEDTLALGAGYADTEAGGGFVAELTYEWVICGAFSIQPSLQYLRYPGEGDGDVDQFVLGARATIVF